MRLRRIESRPRPAAYETEDRRPRAGWKVAITVLLILAVAAALIYWFFNQKYILTTGRVVGVQANVGSPMTGRLAFLGVQEGDSVVKGQLLARLASDELEADLRKANTVLEGARARLQARLQAGIDPMLIARVDAARRDLNLARERRRQAMAEVDKATLRLDQSRLIAGRTERLYLLNAISRGDWEEALTRQGEAAAEYEQKKAALAETEAALQGAQRLLDKAQDALRYARQKLAEEIGRLRTDVREAGAEVERAEAELGKTVIRAPESGLVSWCPRKIGEVVDHNDTILSLLQLDEIWIEAYVSGADLVDLREGSETKIEITGLSDRELRGNVSLFYRKESPPDQVLKVGPQHARSPSKLTDLYHPVKIAFANSVPRDIRPNMVARVWIERW